MVGRGKAEYGSKTAWITLVLWWCCSIWAWRFLQFCDRTLWDSVGCRWMWDRTCTGCGTTTRKEKKNSLKRELMTVPTRLRRASFILDSDTLDPAYLEHSNKTKFYRVSPVKPQAMKEPVTEMLAENILKRSSSAWASLVVLMPERKGEKPRVCVNYFKLKAKTHTDAPPTTNYTRNPGLTCWIWGIFHHWPWKSILAESKWMIAAEIKQPSHVVLAFINLKSCPLALKKCPRHIPEIDGDDVERVLDYITVCFPSWQRNFSGLRAVFRPTVNMKPQFEGIWGGSVQRGCWNYLLFRAYVRSLAFIVCNESFVRLTKHNKTKRYNTESHPRGRDVRHRPSWHRGTIVRRLQCFINLFSSLSLRPVENAMEKMLQMEIVYCTLTSSLQKLNQNQHDSHEAFQVSVHETCHNVTFFDHLGQRKKTFAYAY